MIDLHAHLLPGVDDGASDIEEAVTMLHQASEDGVEVVCATPHIVKGVNERKIVALRSSFKELKEASVQTGVELLLGAEIYLIPELGSLQDLQEITINGNGRYLLVEFPMDRIPPYAKELLAELLRGGIVPILAHPERNLSLQRDPGQLESFVWSGALAQVNVGSLEGTFGRRGAKVARQFLRNGWAHLLASDAHNAQRHTICLSRGAKIAADLIGQEAAHQLVISNPRRIIQGMGVETLTVRPPERGTFRRILDVWRSVPRSRKER